jgi:hypothetical protein
MLVQYYDKPFVIVKLERSYIVFVNVLTAYRDLRLELHL